MAYDWAQLKLSETEQKTLQFCQHKPLSNKEIFIALGYKSLSGNLKKALKRLQEIGLLQYTIPDKPRSQHQQYMLTQKGQK
jgi:ATP-dependent DNA helicase RecG